MCSSTRSASFPRIAAALVTAFLASFFERYVEYDFTADLENQLDEISGGRIRLEQGAGGFLARLLRRGRRHQGSERSRRCIDALDEELGRHFFPDDGRRQGSAALPGLRQRPARLEARQVRRLHRLLELSGMPLYAAAGPRARRRERRERRRRAERLGRSRDQFAGQRCAKVPTATTSSSAKRVANGEKPKRVLAAQGHRARRCRPRDGARAARRCRARSAPIPKTASRSSPRSAASAPISSTARSSARWRADDDVLTIGLNRAVSLLAEPRQARGARRAARRCASLGEHPADGAPIMLYQGPLRPLCQP